MKVAAVFPGQGSQYVEMGRELYDSFTQARELFDQADSVLGYSLTELMFSGPAEELTLTANTQPALLVCGYAAFVSAELSVACTAGHSLGEYTALVAAGALSFEDAVMLVHKRGKFMQDAVRPGAGGMLAVMGADVPTIEAALAEIRQGVCEVANFNCPGQTVVAGDKAGLNEFIEIAAEQSIKTIPLNVSAPFHCSLMKPAADLLALDLDRTNFEMPNIPVYANVTAAKIASGDEARELLKQQVCSSVRWTELMQTMIQNEGVTHSIEFGAGNVLSKLQKRIDKQVVTGQVFDLPTLNQVQAALDPSDEDDE